MTISRAQMKRQLYMQGGLGTLTPRKKYGFGSFVSSIAGGIGDVLGGAADVVGDVVGGAADVVGDVAEGVVDFAKSDIGKAAILAAGGYYLGGGTLPGIGSRAGAQGFQFGNILKPDLTTGIADTTAGSLFTKAPTTLTSPSVPSSVAGMEVALNPQALSAAEVQQVGQTLAQQAAQAAQQQGLPLNIEQLQRQATLPEKSLLDTIGSKAVEYGGKAAELGKKGLRAVFQDPIVNSQGEVTGYKTNKMAVIAAASTIPTYLDAKRFAEEQGVSEEEFDESEYTQMRERYRLSGFKEGGRVGLKDGTPEEGILSVTDEGRSGVMYYDDKGNPLTKEQFFEMVDKDPDQFKKEPQGIMDLMEDQTKDMLRKEGILERLGIEGTRPTAPSIKLRENKKAGTNKKDMDEMITAEDLGIKRTPEKVLVLGENNRLVVVPKDEAVKAGLKIAVDSFDTEQILRRENKKTGTDKKDIDAMVEEELQKETSQSYPFMIGTSPITYLRKYLKKKEIKKRENKMMGGEVPVRKNQGGITELDYRQTGGFVPVGIKEKADDVPAMLSKNEFVMTADAVRGMGNGSVQEGAQRLYNIMKQAEKIGRA